MDEKTGAVFSETGDEADGEVESGFPGLYAAGKTVVGISTRDYVSGLSLADCIYS